MSALDECATAVTASMRSAPEDEIAKAVYRLRILTRGREQRSDGDREAEAVIWIEQLRCWPGDIVLDVLKRWPQRKDGQWWPTWHDVEGTIRARTSVRQALLDHLSNHKPALEKPKPPEKPEDAAARRAQVAALLEKMEAGVGAIAQAKRGDGPLLTPKEDLEISADALRQPVRVSAALLSKIGGAA